MPKLLRQIAIDVEVRRINSQLVARRSCQTLDVERRAGFRVFPNAEDVVGAEDKDVAATRMDEVVAELIDKNLVARIDRAARNHLSGVINVAGKDLKVLPQDLGRRIDGERLMVANDPRKGEEKRKTFAA